MARLLHAASIPVKVDRDLNAGLDASLQLFTERTRGVAGWPLNVFVTPEGYPVFATVHAAGGRTLLVTELEEHADLAYGVGRTGKVFGDAMARSRTGPLDFSLGRAGLAMLPDG